MPHHHHHCLRNTTILITGNSVGRGLHLELADLLGAQPRPSDRDAEKFICPLKGGFAGCFKDQTQLYDHPKCTVHIASADISLHFVWQVGLQSKELDAFYSRLFSSLRSSSRRLLLSTMVTPNQCAAWADGKVGGRNLTWSPPLVRPCINKLLAQWPNHRDMLQRGIESLPQPSTWIHRTHPAIRTVLPPVKYQGELSDQLATLQRDAVDLPIIRDEPPLHLFDTYLDTINVTRKHPEQYEDAIHPGRVVQRRHAQMLLDMHCRQNRDVDVGALDI